MSDHTIVVSADPFGYGFDVEIIPPPEGIGHDREFQTHRAAYSYAARLRMTHKWPIRNLAGRVDRG
jgi:hypothetical protein